MKPEKLTFEAFGPYVKKQEIDFSVFYKTGLFLIHGKTGAGKTTVLDAMTYALFGESSGGGRGDLAAMRSDFAQDEQNTAVSFGFSVHQKRYLFTRELRVRTKRNGEKELQAAQNAFFEDEHGSFVPFFENPGVKNVRQKAEEILGLSCEQFRQVILLPQGKFEELLVADSAAKEEILVTLFKAEQWQEITDWLCDRANDLKKDKEIHEQKIRNLFEQYNCESIEALQTLTDEVETQKRKAERMYADAENILGKTRVSLLNAQTVQALFDERETANQRYQQVLKQQDEIKKLEQKIVRALQAEEILPLRKEAANIMQQQQQWEEKKKQAGQELQEQEKSLANALRVLQSILFIVQEEETALIKEQERLAEQQKEKEEEYKKAFDAYMRDAAFALSENLSEGQACPVCGSEHHPKIAQKSETNITLVQVNRYKEEIECIGKRIQHSEKEGIRLRHILQDCEAALKRYGQAKEETHGQRKEDVSRVQECVEYADVAHRNMQTIRATYDLAKQQSETLGGAFSAAMDVFKEACREKGFETDEQFRASCMDEQERSMARQKIQDYHVNVQVAKQSFEGLEDKLKGVEKPETQTLQAEVREQEAKKQEAESAFASAKAKLELMRNSLEKAAVVQKEIEQKAADYVELDVFAKLLRGDKGVGLKRYVLGVMLSAITRQANRLLKKAHDGRYQLFRTTEGQGRARKVGLDLEVFDAFSGERRSVKSLSGGEKFLVALSLSLGLSAVVQAQSGGIQIDAMFVDEGFGSLDPSSIENALDILAGIRGGQRLVGIISHVQLLKENIEASIEVRKEREGSEIVVNI